MARQDEFSKRNMLAKTIAWPRASNHDTLDSVGLQMYVGFLISRKWHYASSSTMADKSSKPTPTKRTVKNPETFRERAIKATSEGDKPRQRARLRQGIKKLFQPLRSGGRAIANFPLFKPFRKPLHLIGLVIFPRYFRNSAHELKQVTWPTWRESLRLTWAVLLFAIIFGTAVALVDYGLDSVFKRILLK